MSFEIIEQLSKSIVDISYGHDGLLAKRNNLVLEIEKAGLGKKKKLEKELEKLDKDIENSRKSILEFTKRIQEQITQEEYSIKNEQY